VHGVLLSPAGHNHRLPIHGAQSTRVTVLEQIGLTQPEAGSELAWHVTDIVSYSKGAHHLRLGGEVRQAHLNEFYHRRGTGKFVFDGTQGPWSATIANCSKNVTPYPASCTALGFSGPSDAAAV